MILEVSYPSVHSFIHSLDVYCIPVVYLELGRAYVLMAGQPWPLSCDFVSLLGSDGHGPFSLSWKFPFLSLTLPGTILVLSSYFFFLGGVLLCHPSWSAMVQSRLIATSASWVQVILLPQPPE